MTTRNIRLVKNTWTEIAGVGKSVDMQNFVLGADIEVARSASKPVDLKGFIITKTIPQNISGKSGLKVWVKSNKAILLAVD